MATIKIKNGSGAPAASDLVQGEPALDLTNKRLYTEDSGGNVIEVGTNPGVDVTFADNRKAIFGAGSDLQIYHDGSNSRIQDAGSGNLKLVTDGAAIQLQSATENMIVATPDADVQRYYNGVQKLATTNTGIDVTGTAVTDNAVISGYMDFQTGGANKGNIYTDASTMIINTQGTNTTLNTNGGNVGISTSSPTDTLSVGTLGSGSNSIITIGASTTGTSSIYFGDGASAARFRGYFDYVHSSDSLAIGTAAAERMRIDSSGNVLAGKTSSNYTLAGAELRDHGTVGGTTTTQTPFFANRTTNDGALFEFYRGTGTVGQINARSSDLVIGTGTTGLQFYDVGNAIFPLSASGNTNRDAAIDLGEASNRFKNLYLSNAVHATHINLEDAGGNYRTALDFDTSSNLKISTGASAGSRAITFFTENAEQMRLDASGNLLVGTTETDIGFTASGAGCMLAPEGTLQLARDSANELLYLNKLGGNDGDIIRLSTDGNEIGVLGVRANYIKIGNGDTQLLFNSGSDAITPEGLTANRDAAIDLGRTVSRFKDLHLSGVAYSDSVLVGATTFASAGGGHLLASSGTRSSSRTATTTAYHNLFYNSNGLVGGISTSGSATTFTTSSDQRLKDNIVDAPSASDDIDAIQVRSFDWRADGSHQKYGVVAQELQSVAPEAVSEGETEDDMMGVDYSKLVPMLVKEIQSLRARVAQLEGEN
jgi:hypothetical protein